MTQAQEYLKPEVVQTVGRLDLRARFIVEGFLSGLHASPFHGFSVEFSEHRRYTQGDDPKNLDWLVYAKTDRYYVKKYQAETSMTGILVLDLSASMGYTYRQRLTKLDYCISLAAALAYLMIHQQDPVGLITFDQKIRNIIPAHSKRSQLPTILAYLSKSLPSGQTEIGSNLMQVASVVRHKSLIMIFSDLLSDMATTLKGLRLLRHAGHDVILFHVLDEAEVTFPFDGTVELKDPETNEVLKVDALGIKKEYQEAVIELRAQMKKECLMIGADYVSLDTSMRFEKALLEYLSQRKGKG